jgi:predicted transcriptional regulator
MISSKQVRAAKAMLKWSGEELANKAGVSLSTIRRIESQDGILEGQNISTVMSIKSALEKAGIEFIGSPEDKPGVRLK